jgi:lipopolysaccharide transport system ATP-binding protein
MSEIAIRAVELGKEYRIGRVQNNFRTLRDSLAEAVASPFRRATGLIRGEASAGAALDQKFTALDGVSFDVQRSEVIGIIGNNGAGKSTLLKILARVVDPSMGYVEMRGRVSAILEVGTGFHPELTGRENVFLSGAVLGMRKAEIRRRFDEIVDFSEIESFIDTPVKHYSSGMYVRLAFSVAAHLCSEILIVDEVLAVGDFSFQKKCLNKMREINQDGRTVVLVTHNLASARNFCRRGILLDHGKTLYDGPILDAVNAFVSLMTPDRQSEHACSVDLGIAPGRPHGCRPMLRRLDLFRMDGRPLFGELPAGEGLRAEVSFRLDSPAGIVDACLAFNNELGDRIFTAHSLFEPKRSWGQCAGEQKFVCEIPSLPLLPGEYRIKVALDTNGEETDLVEDATRVTLVGSNYYGSGTEPWNGACLLPQRWFLARTPLGIAQSGKPI